MGVELGRVGIWTGVLDAMPSIDAQRRAGLLEELGFQTLWIPETVGRDPFVTASLLLSATDRLNVATGIANIYARDPLTMANTQRTLEEAFPARFLLGLGVSHRTLVEGVRNHDYSKPYSAMVAYLEAMDAAEFRAVGPRQRPQTVLAALGPKMLALSAFAVDGAHPYFTNPEHTALAREIMGPDALLLPEQMVVLETDPSRARDIARKNMKIYLGLPNYANNLRRLGFTEEDIETPTDKLVDAVVAWGKIDAAADRISEHIEAGADHVCVQVLTEDRGDVPEDGWRELALAVNS